MNSPTEQHLGAAFRDLVAEQPFTPDVPAIERRARQARRRHRIARGGIGVGNGAGYRSTTTSGRTARTR
jgi:hypothetical protein